MMRRLVPLAALLGVAGCVPFQVRTVSGGDSRVAVQILAINDFHGNLEPSADPVTIATGSGSAVEERVGGAARLAAALETARAGQRNTITVAAGDLIRLETRRGAVAVKVRSDRDVPEGMVFMPFCYAEAAANLLTNPALDPFGKIPEFKFCAVRVTPC